MPEREQASGGMGKLVFFLLILVVAGVGYLGFSLLGNGEDKPDAPGGTTAGGGSSGSGTGTNTPPPANGEQVVVRIAYGTEKKNWLKQALEIFESRPESRGIRIELVGRGSVEGAKEVLQGKEFHVWSPASSAYRDVFETEWQLTKGGGSPIIKSENLALTPMVFVMWQKRRDAFVQKFGQANFDAIFKAMTAEGGWNDIAGQPDWGLFKFGHTHPNKSNSGLLSLVLMAYDHASKERGLTVADITNAEFQRWLGRFERAVARPGGSLSHSTGKLMETMVLRGPSYYDAIMVYENLAIEYLGLAQGRWEPLAITYPERNMWNEHPYYILDVPWSKPANRRAAETFLDFLMSEEIQRKALDYGFRPGNPRVPIKFEGSPFVRYEQAGIRVEIPRVCEPPKADVLRELEGAFRRAER